MQRRTWLKFGLVGGALVALGGGMLAWVRPGWTDGRLTAQGRELFAAVARAVLEGILPDVGAAATATTRPLQGQLDRLEATVQAMPAVVQAEIADLTALLLHPAGRYVLLGLGVDWSQATVADLRPVMQGLRESRLALRQQTYHALRDLTNAAYFADASAWGFIGYPGPRSV
jgi:hypothetical protein